MPVTLDSSSSAVSAQADLSAQAIKRDKQNVILTQISPTGYLCSMPVTVVEEKIDLTDIPSGSTIETILKLNQKPVLMKVNEGVKVSVLDPLKVHTKISVRTENGNQFRVKDHAYLSTTNYENINGEYSFKDHDFGGTELKTTFKIDHETFERSVPAPTEYEIFCRHIALAALMLRKEHPKNAWSTSCQAYLSQEALPTTFSNMKAYEDVCVDVHAASQAYYLLDKQLFGPTLSGMFQSMSKQVNPSQSLEAKFYVVLNGPDVSIAGHSCAMVLKCENDKDNNKTFKVKLYDPNLTYNHMTFASQDLDKIKNLRFEDMFKLHRGYKELDALAFFELNKNWSEGVSQLATTWNETKTVYRVEYSPELDKLQVTDTKYIKNNLELWGFKKVSEDELPYGD